MKFPLKFQFNQSRGNPIEDRLTAFLGQCGARIAVSAVGLFAFVPGWAQTVDLATAAPFGVLAASAITSTGPSIVLGDLGISPNTQSSVTGFPPGQVIGTSHFNDAVAVQAKLDLTTAYNSLAGRPCGTVVTTDLAGMTLFPGVYCAATSLGLSGTLTLDAQGDPNAEFIFQAGSTLTTGSNAVVQVINGGQNCNVYWQVGSSATLGTGTSFVGSILALASITVTTGSTVSGRLLARNAAVTLDSNAVTVCSLVGNAPALSKEFNLATILAGGVSTLTITLSNPNPSVATLTSALVDTLPLGVVIAPLPNLSTTCGGSGAPLATAGGNSVSLPAGRTIPSDGNCTLSVNVTAAANGQYINTLASGALQTSNGANLAPAVATLTVVGLVPPPTLGKAFNPSVINAGGVSTLTITLSNPHSVIATLSSPLLDTLPIGVLIAALPNASTNCGGVGAPIAIAGAGSASLPAGRSIPANGSCNFSFDVSAALAGTYINTLNAGALVTNNGNNALPAVASLTVLAIGPVAPELSKSFTPSTINAGGTSILTVTLSNPNPAIATLTAPLIDTLPSGVLIAALPNASSTCGGVAPIVAVSGSNSVTLPAGRTIPGNGSCTLIVSVSAALGGSYINTLIAGALQTSNGNNPAPAIATLTVVSAIPPPVLGKAFSPATISANGLSTLTITLNNPHSVIATLTAPLIDNLPNGVLIAPIPNASSTCGVLGVPVATPGSSSISLPAGSTIIANGSCTITVRVTAAAPGGYVNTLVSGSLMTSNGNNLAPALATLTVIAVPRLAPILSKAFAPSTINAGGLSTLTITLNNPDPLIATLTAPLVDTLPNGVLVAALPNVSTTCGGTGAPLAVAGGNTVSLPVGRTIPANGSCTITVTVTAAAPGTYVNILVAGSLITSNGNNLAPAQATLIVIPVPPLAPTLSKAFAPSTINAGGLSTLTITLNNPDPLIATLTAPLVDTLPNGVLVAALPNVSTTCGGTGAPLAVAGGNTVSLPVGRTIPANGSCTITVTVTAAAPGTYVNILVAGSLITSNGNNLAPAQATLTVIAGPAVIPVPTLSNEALLLLVFGVMLIGIVGLRR